jgi:hypothetical protein
VKSDAVQEPPSQQRGETALNGAKRVCHASPNTETKKARTPAKHWCPFFYQGVFTPSEQFDDKSEVEKAEEENVELL